MYPDYPIVTKDLVGREAVPGRTRPYQDVPGPWPYLAVPGRTLTSTLDTGYLPVYCTQDTLYLGTLSHLDRCPLQVSTREVVR